MKSLVGCWTEEAHLQTVFALRLVEQRGMQQKTGLTRPVLAGAHSLQSSQQMMSQECSIAWAGCLKTQTHTQIAASWHAA